MKAENSCKRSLKVKDEGKFSNDKQDIERVASLPSKNSNEK